MILVLIATSYASPDCSSYPSSFVGSGTLVDPYQISDCSQLQCMNTDLTASYELINDIDCSQTYNWNFDGSNYRGFIPIGNTTTLTFSGNFDGNNHKIKNLYINRPSLSYSALFGYVNSISTPMLIKDITLVDFEIYGKLNSAVLIGRLQSRYAAAEIRIIDVHASGIIDSSGQSGGLIGMNWPRDSSVIEIINSSAKVDISSNGNSVGGLVGFNLGYQSGLVKILNSYATGNILDGSSYNGGLVGENEIYYGNVLINNSYARGNVTGSYSGGLVGFNEARNSGATDKISILNSYATGNVSGTSFLGGLVGRNYAQYGDIEVYNSYATGNIFGGTAAGLIGTNDAYGGENRIFNSYWLDNLGDDASRCYNSGNDGCTSELLESYFFDVNNSPMTSWDFSKVWDSIDDEIGYPTFLWIPSFEISEPSWSSDYMLSGEDGNPIVNFTKQNKIYIKKEGSKKIEFEINDSIDLSSVIVEADSYRTLVVNLGFVSGIVGTHSLFINNTNDVGVFVCPDSVSLSAIHGGCSNLEKFNHSECLDSITRSGFTCSIVDGYYKVSGLTGSGIGEGCVTDDDCDIGLTCVDSICQAPIGASVPEFNNILLIFVLSGALIGIFFFRK